MAHIIADRVMESSTSSGTGIFALAGAGLGYRAFSAVCAIADTVPYYIEAVDALGALTGDWEYGLGTYNASNQLTRTTVRGSSNGGAAVNFSAGTKIIGLGVPAPNSAATRSEWRAALQAAESGANASITSMSAVTSMPTALTPLGNGQTYQNVGGSRAIGANYVNASGRTIAVFISFQSSGASQSTLQVTVAGVSLPGHTSANASTGTIMMLFFVPPGAAYSVALASGISASLGGWYELRT